nr:hypothetical protein [Pandoravirus massiliensis]
MCDHYFSCCMGAVSRNLEKGQTSDQYGLAVVDSTSPMAAELLLSFWCATASVSLFLRCRHFQSAEPTQIRRQTKNSNSNRIGKEAKTSKHACFALLYCLYFLCFFPLADSLLPSHA